MQECWKEGSFISRSPEKGRRFSFVGNQQWRIPGATVYWFSEESVG